MENDIVPPFVLITMHVILNKLNACPQKGKITNSMRSAYIFRKLGCLSNMLPHRLLSLFFFILILLSPITFCFLVFFSKILSCIIALNSFARIKFLLLHTIVTCCTFILLRNQLSPVANYSQLVFSCASQIQILPLMDINDHFTFDPRANPD